MIKKQKTQRVKGLKKELKEPDFTALDEAVSELSKQTAALLGQDESPEKKAKPTLPKKQAKPKARGHSFDIIQPKIAAKAAHLKTAVAKKAPAQLPEQELLPEHASLSFNEVTHEELAKKDDVAVQNGLETGAVVQGHKEGALRFNTEEVAEGEPVSEDETIPAVAKAPPTVTKEPVELKKPEADSERAADKTETEEEKLGQQEAEVAPSYESSGSYVHNLATQKAPKRYEPHEAQQKPTVFDTNEYHESLHDWSKLDRRSGGKWLILLLLVVVAAALAYTLFMLNLPLPFVG